MDWLRDLATVVGALPGVVTLILIIKRVLPSLRYIERDRNKKTLAALPEFPPPTESEQARARDKEAKQLLEGAGLKEWKLGNRTWKIGDIVYVDGEGWREAVFPDPQSREGPSASCVMGTGGSLTIRGLSKTRHAALVEYTSPPGERSGGTQCKTGTFFFYPLPKYE